ncbi:hypothetical protein BRARA_A02274 [Brassica rapa]|uniref:pectinesterase n=2 Tax=Brassica TaxID=3705 RepID=A0A816XXJ3_BRANA|nr:probable pectinesterase 29 [Brassica napus]RID79543.1 hypothetical protein BRARA_A02274 [Brassica rapa]CAF2152316.1 unnamed protein product [Brassica napus]CAG7888906.1 unnamed protein product [Brassica rapa]VDC76389.1 unnamed protein product [Brassica rapa]
MKYLTTALALSFLYLFTDTSSHFSSGGLDMKDFNKDRVKTVVVSHRGTGDFRTIQAAIDSIPSNNNNWIKIYLKHGTYNEKIVIEKQMIVMQGNDASKVTIQYNDAGLANSSGPFRLNAEYFVAINITFKNTYNNIKQTVPYKDIKVAPSAILMADKASFYGCRFISVQDTLADLLGRHYFHKCYIEGAVDFIWGRGQSIYQNCVINVKGVTSKKMVNNREMLAGFITAQGRESEQDTSGFVFNKCVIKGTGKAFLGRAYRGYSRVVFYGTHMSNVVVPQGWDAWHYKGQEDKFTFVEVNSTGKGANKKGRVRWEKNLSAKEVDFLLNPQTFVDNDGWMATLPSALVSLY